MLCDVLAEGMDGDLGACRNAIGDLVRSEVIARTRKRKLHHSTRDEATGNNTDGNRFVFAVGLVASEEARPCVEVSGVLADRTLACQSAGCPFRKRNPALFTARESSS